MDRPTVAAALVALAALAAVRLLARGFELSLRMCALGGCSEPEDSRAGAGLLAAAVVTMIAGLVAAPRIAGASHPWWRAVAAVPVGLAVALALASLGLGPWGGRLTWPGALLAVTFVLVGPTPKVPP